VLAQAVYNDGHYEQAEQLAHEAAQAARPNDVHTQIIWRGVVAKVLARRGELEAAERLAREAVAYAETSDFLHSHTDALMDLAEVLSLRGRSEEAAMALQDAIQLFDHKGNVIAAAQARARLEDL
jgi:ATP/maltotriose-dependent transcriptional regulator MalT